MIHVDVACMGYRSALSLTIEDGIQDVRLLRKRYPRRAQISITKPGKYFHVKLGEMLTDLRRCPTWCTSTAPH